ncbi:MAG: hypothetical protein KGL39_54625 [Patescibacteria group bacterium]|nr:hypothetical protein [Patescibacteria group bacterium]
MPRTRLSSLWSRLRTGGTWALIGLLCAYVLFRCLEPDGVVLLADRIKLGRMGSNTIAKCGVRIANLGFRTVSFRTFPECSCTVVSSRNTAVRPFTWSDISLRIDSGNHHSGWQLRRGWVDYWSETRNKLVAKDIQISYDVSGS